MNQKEHAKMLKRYTSGSIDKKTWKKHLRAWRKHKKELLVKNKFSTVHKLGGARITNRDLAGIKKTEKIIPKKAKFANMLRRNMTRTEQIFWNEWQRLNLIGLAPQIPLYGYIVDFLIVGKKIVIEFDGSSHDDRKEYDALRTKHLREKGYKVIRFENEEVLNKLDSVIQSVKDLAEIVKVEKPPNKKRNYLAETKEIIRKMNS